MRVNNKVNDNQNNIEPQWLSVNNIELNPSDSDKNEMKISSFVFQREKSSVVNLATLSQDQTLEHFARCF